MGNAAKGPRILSKTIVYCFYNLISLSFFNTIKFCPHLDTLATYIKIIVIILWKSSFVQFIGEKCLFIIETRWIYLYVLKFILDNSDDISILLAMMISLRLKNSSNFSILFCNYGFLFRRWNQIIQSVV